MCDTWFRLLTLLGSIGYVAKSGNVAVYCWTCGGDSMSERDEAVAKLLAMTRLKSKTSQPERVLLVRELGIDAAIDQISGQQQDLFGTPALELDRAIDDLQRWQEQGIRVTSILDPDYPLMLATVREAPALVYSLGVLDPGDLGVAVVGTRNADPLDIRNATNIAGMLDEEGFTVISGLAAGVDGAAHRGALSRGCRTVAVVGTGLDRTYPREHVALQNQIIESGGLILSQFEPGAAVTRASFPMRNVTMSGYSLGMVVVAASENSGTRNQAKRALQHGRNVFLTDAVVRNTLWGQEMSQQAGVYSIKTVKDLKDRLHRLRSMQGLLLAQ